MNKLLFLITLAAITMTGCASGNNKTKDETKNSTPQTVSQEGKKDGTRLITKEEFRKKVWNYQEFPDEWKFLGDQPVVIDFYADWCGPCRIASPILEEVSNEFAGKIAVYKIDTQKERELAGIFGIQSIPAFLYIPMEGKPVMMAGIGRSEEETKKMFIENINKYLLSDK